MTLKLCPISIGDAKAFVARHHRHNLPPLGGLFAVACECDGKLCGVAVVGRPVARMLQDGQTCEVTRLCTDGTRNACTILYGACCRAARALGYARIYTYTLASESGISLKASGWNPDAQLPGRETWNCPARSRYQTDLFGNDRRPRGAKIRWIKMLVAS